MLINNLSDKALIEVAYILSPLRYLNSPEQVALFMRKIGYEIPETDLVSVFEEISDLVLEVISAAQQLIAADTDSEKLNALSSLLPIVQQALGVANTLEGAIRTAPRITEDFVEKAPLSELPKRLVDYLIFLTLSKRYPKIFGTLYLIGIIDESDLLKETALYQPAFNLKLIHWEKIPQFIAKPGIVIDDIYQWNTDFKSNLFFRRLELFLQALAIPGGIYKQSITVKNALGNTTADLSEIRIPVLSDGIYPQTYAQLGFNLTPIEANGIKKKGIAIIPYLLGAIKLEAEISNNWEISLNSSAALDNGLGILIRPPIEVEVLENILTNPIPIGTMDMNILVRQKNKVIDQIPKIFLFGHEGSSYLSLSGISASYQIQTNLTQADVEFEISIKEIDLLITTGDGDGFLQQILPKDGVHIDFDLAIGWSNKKGLYFRGGAGLEATLPINKNLFDVLLINSVYLAILAKESGISLAAATSVTLKMGPVVVAIEQMGLKADISFPERGGNLGPIDLKIDFKPPKGAGLVIDASAVVGAGFLEFDPDNAMYSGFIYLEIVKKISVTAVGLITTRMPDGSPGFSLLALVAVQFSPGIQLGYGFTLNGLGGLLGINRTVTVDVLRSGLRNGTLGSILFPSDPKKNIARIISDLKAVFPPAEGRFVFGPMVILGWGPNELIKLELGIILELPDPVRLLILGRLSLKLPDEKNPVVRLKLDSLGVIEFATGDVSLDAVLYDSEIKGFTITGEMALRANFGASPGFLLSVGGFHPAFKAPPGFPALQRVAISLATGDNPRLRLAAYMAITTNTVQFGAALEIYAEAGGFSLEGQLSFDALIQFDPFGLAISLGAMIAIKSGKQVLLCIKLDMNLTGPTPWHAWGEARFTLLLIEVKIPFEVKSGEELLPELPAPVDLLPRMEEALKEPANWSTQLPPGEHPLVVFREQAKGSGILVHPLALLQVSQRVAPLNEDLYKFGNATLKDGVQHFKLSVDGKVPQQSDFAKDWFAPAHFREMTDDEKIAADSFEQKDAGIRFTQEGFGCGIAVVENEMEYETASSEDAQPYRLTNEFLEQVACLGVVGQSLLLKTGNARYQSDGIKSAPAPVFNVKPRSFIVVGSDAATGNESNSVRRKSTGSSSKRTVGSQEATVVESYSEALDLLKKNRSASPATRARLKIVPL